MFNNQEISIILPAKIISFDVLTQTAEVQIAFEHIHNDSEAIGKVTKREPLLGVPVHTVSGGGWSMTMPIKEGDTCLMYFSQIGYDHWLVDDAVEAGMYNGRPDPCLSRQFDEDDGLALVGFNTLPRVIQNFSDKHSQWRNSDATQLISLNEDLSIGVDSPTELRLTAPKVIIDGDLEVTGATTGASATYSGDIEGAEVTAGGIVLTKHKHAILSGSSSGNTDLPS